VPPVGDMHLPQVETTDVLISGAGPAGCAAGILLARRGLRVVILERRPPTHRKVCGDLLGPRTLWILRDLRLGWTGPAAGATPIRSIQIFDESRRVSWAPFAATGGGDAPAQTLRRDRFDRFLRDRATEAGCRILHGVCFRRILERPGSSLVCGAAEEGRERRFAARVLLGADGAASAVAAAAGLRVRNARRRILAARAYFRGVAGLRDSLELYFLPQIFPGYAWVIPVGAGTANVGLGMRADACVRKGIRPLAAVQRFARTHPVLSARLRRAQQEGSFQGWTMGTYQRDMRRSAPHVLLLGDAGHCPDPLSGEGIYGALKSASLAAPWVCRAFEQGDFSASLLSGYDRDAERHFRPAYRYGGFLASLPSDHPLLEPLVRWGLGRVASSALQDPATVSVPDAEEPPGVQGWSRVALVGPGDNFYRCEIARKDGHVYLRGTIRGQGKPSGVVELEMHGDKLVFDGEEVGQVYRDGTVAMCTDEFDPICALRIDPGENRLYVEFLYDEMRDYESGEIPAGDWTSFLVRGGISIERLIGEPPAFCSGEYENQCAVFSQEGDLELIPNW